MQIIWSKLVAFKAAYDSQRVGEIEEQLFNIFKTGFSKIRDKKEGHLFAPGFNERGTGLNVVVIEPTAEFLDLNKSTSLSIGWFD